jgi:hypothetical protein
VFWIVFGAALAVVLLVAWVHDRRSGTHPTPPPSDRGAATDSGSLRLYRSGNSGLGL